MVARSWIRRLFARPPRTIRKATARCRPAVETLEDRLTPAYSAFTQLTEATNPFNGFDLGFASAPALGDMDGDGDLDAVMGTGIGMLQYFRNTGTATNPVYAEQTSTANPFNGIDVGSAAMPALGDVDGDADLDLVVGNKSGVPFYFRANRAPVLDNAIPDQTFSGQGTKSYTVPANTFLDLDHDALTSSATLVGSAALPAWLSFNPATRAFSGNPSPSDTTPLQIRVTATDADGKTVSDDFQLTLRNVNDAPTVEVPAARTAFEDVDHALTGITVGDPEGDGLTVTLAVTHGNLTLGTTTGLTFTAGDGSGDATMTFSGTIAHINAALAGLLYRGGLNYSGGDSLSITADDGGRSTTRTVAITVKSAAQQTADLRTKVTDLQKAGVLTRKQANTLLATLDLKGNDGDAGKVQSFLNEVRGLRQNGTLSVAQAAELLALGDILLLSVTRR